MTVDPDAPQPQGRGGGRGGFPGGGAGGYASAVQGLNRAAWNNPRLPSLFTVPPGIVMWGGGGNAGPKVAPGTYTVKVSSGTWSQSQTFRLGSDPRYTPVMTDAQGQEQLKMATEVGGMINTLYAELARLRDAKRQANAISEKAGAPVQAAAKTLIDRLVAAESELTQIQGEGGQDALNFPGRLDNQLIALYGSVSNTERRLGSPITERYKDLKPEADKLLKQARTALTTDIAAFNAVASKAGAGTITVK